MTVPVAAADPVCGYPDFRLADVVLRLARADERREWDQLMDAQHYLGFRQFAGRGLRYVAEWHGRWLALLGWQTGVFQCAPRDEWIGWHKAVQMRRLHLCANNTRFLILGAAAGVQNLGSYVLGANLRRLSADWERNWGHPLLLAEAFVEMRRYKGSVYLAANWIPVGVTKGYARSNGKYTNKHGVKKKMLVYPLQAETRELLRHPQERAEWHCEAVRVQYSQAELASLRELLEEVPDARKARGLRHPLGAVLALLVLAKLAGRHGGRAAEKFCKQLPQRDLRVLRCRFNRNRSSGRWDAGEGSLSGWWGGRGCAECASWRERERVLLQRLSGAQGNARYWQSMHRRAQERAAKYEVLQREQAGKLGSWSGRWRFSSRRMRDCSSATGIC